METYSWMREFADSWMLLALFLIFVGVILRTLSGRRALHEDAANVIFRHDTPDGSDAKPASTSHTLTERRLP